MNTEQIFIDLKNALDNNLISIDDYNEIFNNLMPLKDFNDWFSLNKTNLTLSIEINTLLNKHKDNINNQILHIKNTDDAKEMLAKTTANIVSNWTNSIGYENSSKLELAIIQLLMLQ